MNVLQRIQRGGLGMTRTRDLSVDLYLLNTENKRLQEEISIAQKVFPTLQSVVFKGMM